MTLKAARLPSQGTTRLYWFSTFASLARSCLNSITMDCSRSSGSKPEVTTVCLPFWRSTRRAAADDGGDVSGADESIEAHIRRIEDGADGGHDSDVIAEDSKIPNALFFRTHQCECSGGRCGFESNGKEYDFLVGFFLAISSASAGE